MEDVVYVGTGWICGAVDSGWRRTRERQKELESCGGDAWKISCTRVRFIKLHATIERTIFQHRTRSPCLSCPFARTLWWGWIKRHYLGLIHNIIIIITIYTVFYPRHKMRTTFNQLIRGMRVIRMRYSAFIFRDLSKALNILLFNMRDMTICEPVKWLLSGDPLTHPLVQWTEIARSPGKLQRFPQFIIAPRIPQTPPRPPWPEELGGQICDLPLLLSGHALHTEPPTQFASHPFEIRLNSPYNQQDYWIYHPHHNNRIPGISVSHCISFGLALARLQMIIIILFRSSKLGRKKCTAIKSRCFALVSNHPTDRPTIHGLTERCGIHIHIVVLRKRRNGCKSAM